MEPQVSQERPDVAGIWASGHLERVQSTFILGNHLFTDSWMHTWVWRCQGRGSCREGVVQGCRWFLAQVPTGSQPDLQSSPAPLAESNLALPTSPYPWKDHLLICAKVLKGQECQGWSKTTLQVRGCHLSGPREESGMQRRQWWTETVVWLKFSTLRWRQEERTQCLQECLGSHKHKG